MKKQIPKILKSKPTSGKSKLFNPGTLVIKRGRSSYTRLFRLKKNVDLAIRLIKEGLSNNKIALRLHCDHTSVIAFRKRLSLGTSEWAQRPKKLPKLFIHELKPEYGLTMKEWDITEMYYGLSGFPPMTYYEIGIHYGETPVSIQKLEFKARKKIRKYQDYEQRGYHLKKNSNFERFDVDGSKINKGKSYTDYMKLEKKRNKDTKSESKKRAYKTITDMYLARDK